MKFKYEQYIIGMLVLCASTLISPLDARGLGGGRVGGGHIGGRRVGGGHIGAGSHSVNVSGNSVGHRGGFGGVGAAAFGGALLGASIGSSGNKGTTVISPTTNVVIAGSRPSIFD
jgi:hypothetical protein